MINSSRLNATLLFDRVSKLNNINRGGAVGIVVSAVSLIILIYYLSKMSTTPDSGFYMTVFSEEDGGKSHSHFKVRLPEQIRLDDREWYVGITEFSFMDSRTLLNITDRVEGTILFDVDDQVYSVVVDDQFFGSLDTLIDTINTVINSHTGISDVTNFNNAVDIYPEAAQFVLETVEKPPPKTPTKTTGGVNTPPKAPIKSTATVAKTVAKSKNVVVVEDDAEEEPVASTSGITSASTVGSSNVPTVTSAATPKSKPPDAKKKKLASIAEETPDPPTSTTTTTTTTKSVVRTTRQAIVVDPPTNVHIDVEVFPSSARISRALSHNILDISMASTTRKLTITRKDSKLKRIWFSPKIQKVLGFFGIIDVTASKVKADFEYDLTNANDGLLIYSDIIKPQITGPSKSRLLKMIPVKPSVELTRQTWQFAKVYYYPVERLCLTEIDIDIRNLANESIYLSQGPTILVLRFV